LTTGLSGTNFGLLAFRLNDFAPNLPPTPAAVNNQSVKQSTVGLANIVQWVSRVFCAANAPSLGEGLGENTGGVCYEHHRARV
jgi:hypothetical protein